MDKVFFYEVFMNNELMLSIYVPVYNHEKYIVRALDSILMQKTKYRYEVWIGEDASTDDTRAVLMEYEKKCPPDFHFLYREKNMHNSECRNDLDLRLRCKGKYLICLEGDDFWTDENKIEKQIDFLESHPEYIAVSHNCVVVGKDSLPNGEEYPECKDTEYTFKHLASEIMPGQFTTVMMKNYMLDKNFNSTILCKKLLPLDRLVYFFLLCYGKVYCMQETMSAYRHITDSGTSYSATYKYNFIEAEEWHEALLNYSRSINRRTAIQYAEILYVRCIWLALRKKAIKFTEFCSYFKKHKLKLSSFMLCVKGYINKKVFHKNIWY